jgi:hypothetical protein
MDGIAADPAYKPAGVASRCLLDHTARYAQSRLGQERVNKQEKTADLQHLDQMNCCRSSLVQWVQ